MTINKEHKQTNWALEVSKEVPPNPEMGIDKKKNTFYMT